ncbi:MAG: hypothetical protein ABIZ50_02445, partial [Solirubrobacterales bacterium]
LVDNSDEILGCASGLAGRRAATGREIMNSAPSRGGTSTFMSSRPAAPNGPGRPERSEDLPGGIYKAEGSTFHLRTPRVALSLQAREALSLKAGQTGGAAEDLPGAIY